MWASPDESEGPPDQMTVSNHRKSKGWAALTRIPKWIVGPRRLPRDDLYLGWPIAPSYMSPNAGVGGSCGVSANEYRTAVHRSPNKLWGSNSIFNLWYDPLLFWPPVSRSIVQWYGSANPDQHPENRLYTTVSWIPSNLYCLQIVDPEPGNNHFGSS